MSVSQEGFICENGECKKPCSNDADCDGANEICNPTYNNCQYCSADHICENGEEDLAEEPNDLEDDVGITSTVGNDRDSAVPQFACTQGVSRDPAQADSEASRDPGEAAAAARRLSADSQSSLLASQHSVRLIPACHAADDSHPSKSRSRSQLQPEEASQFLTEEEMRINMAQPVFSEAHHQVT